MAGEALTTVVASCYLLGVFTRRIGEFGETLGGQQAVQEPGVDDGERTR